MTTRITYWVFTEKLHDHIPTSKLENFDPLLRIREWKYSESKFLNLGGQNLGGRILYLKLFKSWQEEFYRRGVGPLFFRVVKITFNLCVSWTTDTPYTFLEWTLGFW